MFHYILLLLPNTLASCLINNCEICSSKSENICINCIQGYTRDPIQGCLKFQNFSHSKNIENCIQQKDSTCQQCSEGYNLINGFCDPSCDLENCICFYPNICLKIPRSLQCSDKYCKTCTQDGLSCENCIEGFGIDKSGLCTQCYDINCKICSYNANICNECLDDYYMTREKGCYKCMSSGCNSCNVDDTICDSCSNGNIMLENGRCCDGSCLTCSELSPACTSCHNNFMIYDDFCYPCSNFFCKNCTSTYCYECIDGYELFDGICIEKHCHSIACLSCPNSTNVCEQCHSNFVQDLFGNCCNIGCKTCTSTSPYCTSCIDGMYLESSYCLFCSKSCKTCSYFDKCSSCPDGFTLSRYEGFCVEGERISDGKLIVFVIVPVTIFVLAIVFTVCCLCNNNRKKMFRAIRLHNEKKANVTTTNPEVSISSDMPNQSIQLKNSSIMHSSSIIDMAIDKLSFPKKHSISIDIPKAKRTNSSIMKNSAELSHQLPCTYVSPKNLETNHADDEITEMNFEKMVIIVELDNKKTYNDISICLICEENFNDKDVRALPCGHPYHEKCIYKSFIVENKRQCLKCLREYS
ncbi:hypothetical protein SteCoe_36835 [Stentor coeruleus]|uniref:RING-type domain-containing protein n=1 Tax=Stentor coeruleus TaxID=5963 RepID=A0A1R2APH8_9CILI|nr:hypothetical protein SteCoe_36835 [Stentor coeruleus]